MTLQQPPWTTAGNCSSGHTQQEGPVNSSCVPTIPSILEPWLVQRLGLTEGLMNQLLQMPGTCQSMREVRQRMLALSEWRAALQQGFLPSLNSGMDWPGTLFSRKMVKLLGCLGVPSFLQHHPALLDSVLHHVLIFAQAFEKMQAEQQKQTCSSSCCLKGDCNRVQPGQPQCKCSQGQGQKQGGMDKLSEQMRRAAEEMELRLSLDPEANGNRNIARASERQELPATLEQGLEEMLQTFKKDWEAMTGNAEVADDVFGPEAMHPGAQGHSDFASAFWKRNGWKEMARLQKLLQESKELRDLVESLGRGRGQACKQKAAQQIACAGKPAGMIRSPLAPEETAGICRSGDLSCIMPAEAQLIAAGWPIRDPGSLEDAATSQELQRTHGQDSSSSQSGSRAARLLHMSRRAERNLMSYEQTGWLNGEPAKPTGRQEMRPAVKAGPIIICLDTSGSMQGIPEMTAKAVTLECMRSAQRQGRKCYLYSFSGPGQTQERDLSSETMEDMLEFLEHTFEGGTDLQAPLHLSLERLQKHDWSLADILLVTDGDVPHPASDLLKKIRAAEISSGVKLHGLIVDQDQLQQTESACASYAEYSKQLKQRMQQICSHVHSLSAASMSRFSRELSY
ncbi:hypothetical protein WJX84_001144 [Apatococcus fuscideae]|uniref:VWFA domain-containing protein n=1 Tax=Apatococcus fuscideae TaxID=2026836 RepID=A0AAW1T7C6_9CHLO